MLFSAGCRAQGCFHDLKHGDVGTNMMGIGMRRIEVGHEGRRCLSLKTPHCRSKGGDRRSRLLLWVDYRAAAAERDKALLVCTGGGSPLMAQNHSYHCRLVLCEARVARLEFVLFRTTMTSSAPRRPVPPFPSLPILNLLYGPLHLLVALYHRPEFLLLP